MRGSEGSLHARLVKELERSIGQLDDGDRISAFVLESVGHTVAVIPILGASHRTRAAVGEERCAGGRQSPSHSEKLVGVGR